MINDAVFLPTIKIYFCIIISAVIKLTLVAIIVIFDYVLLPIIKHH